MQKPNLEEAINTASKVFGSEIPIMEIAEIMKTEFNLIHTEIKKNILNNSIQGRIDSKSTSNRFDDILILKDISKTEPTSTEHKDPCWEKLRKNTLEGINCYKKKLGQKLSDPEVYYGLVMGYLLQQDVVKANAILEECISEHFGLDCVKIKIIIAIDEENYSESLALTLKALELYPEDKDFWNSLLVILIQLKRIDEALSSSKKSIEIFPEDLGILKIRLHLLNLSGKWDELSKFVEKFLPEIPGDESFQMLVKLSKLKCANTEEDFLRFFLLFKTQNSFMLLLVLNLLLTALGWYIYYSIVANFDSTLEIIKIMQYFYTWVAEREKDTTLLSNLELKSILTPMSCVTQMEQEKNLPEHSWQEFNTRKIEEITLKTIINQIKRNKPEKLRELLNGKEFRNAMEESPYFALIKETATFPVDFLRGIAFLLQDNLIDAEVYLKKAFEKKDSLPIEISQQIESTYKISIRMQSTTEIIQDQKIRFKRRNRLDELLKTYDELSLEKMTRLMDLKDNTELENFLIELPENVPVKILGNKVRLGRHDFTSSMIEKMDKALEGWERSGFGAYSSTVFSCQIDGGTHPLKEAHYQCVSCHRFVCDMCYTALKEVGRIICPYCESSLRFIAPIE